MAFDTTQIKFFYSGGSTNLLQSKSIGGEMSVYEIKNDINKVFDKSARSSDREEFDAKYRCIYVKNDSTEIIYDLKIYFDQSIENLSELSLGVLSRNEVQRFIIPFDVSGGDFRFRVSRTLEEIDYVQDTSAISFSSTVSTMENNIKTNLEALSILDTITVTGSTFDSGWYYDIEFDGLDSNRGISLMEVVDDTLTGSTESVRILPYRKGGPFEGTADKIGSQSQSPKNVDFSEANDLTSAITLGTMYPKEHASIWLKKTPTRFYEKITTDKTETAKLLINFNVEEA